MEKNSEELTSQKTVIVSKTIECVETTETPKTGLSKNQQKKLIRLERALAFKPIKRKLEREKRKLKGRANMAVIERLNGEIVNVNRKSLKKNLMSTSTNKLKICIDCSFEDKMGFSDLRHLGKQLAYCYGTNRRMESPLQLYLTSMNGQTKKLLEKSGLSNWDCNLTENHFLDEFKDELRENICYLTSDSPNELTEFDEKKVYIIGGIVDHNHHKSLCYDLALKNNLMHYRLPINKFMEMKTRPVLTVNQVYDIICKYTECKDWLQAFRSTLPKRKGAQQIQGSDSSEKSPLINQEQTEQLNEHEEPAKKEQDLSKI